MKSGAKIMIFDPGEAIKISVEKTVGEWYCITTFEEVSKGEYRTAETYLSKDQAMMFVDLFKSLIYC